MDKVCCSPSTFAFLIFDADHPEGLDFLLFDLLGKKSAKTFEVVLLDSAISSLGKACTGCTKSPVKNFLQSIYALEIDL